ncbi:AbrB/MazE/SpoVT family DNA-binding domain-containing protein [Natrinema altunense]|uniref:Transcription regulator n=1 Tax=Natrinema altunense (strain JCM 12890 / CGMCC 1.3731 / AJ2) TaxID=1227494 RepID=L9ZIK4_NATA2|nr:AbrB/MazE/SpoVT family DNA-binding domain-containing protein [Natrinema altunense]ELY84973.1 transcription regulator [Natrinema altunense JCM 12890]
MSRSTNDPEVVRVSQKGQTTIPKALREKFGIETPGEVFVHEEDERIVIEPVPSPDELHGIHAGGRESGTVTDRVRELKDADHRREEGPLERLRPNSDE